MQPSAPPPLPPGPVSSDATIADHEQLTCCHRGNENSRNLIVCIDGTSNQFGEKNTNVIELYSLIDVWANQETWYNSGIGTYARPSWKSLKHYKKVLWHKIDLAIAWDFERTVLGAYRWLSDNYQPRDRIFLFGFSRGAFQVRVLSAMIDKVGLIRKGNEMQIPFAYELYADHKSGGKIAPQVGLQDKNVAPDSKTTENVTMAERFKRAFSNDVTVHLVGAWDTVSSIGIIRGKRMLPGTIDGMKHVCYFRHALALDERRVKFLPEYAYGGRATKSGEREDNGIKSGNTITIDPHTKEVWFAGTHSDIGGGNVQNAGMDRTRPPLRWMMFEAMKLGLRAKRITRHLASTEQIAVKESLQWYWWPLEYFPFKRLTFTRKSDGRESTFWFHRGSSRKIHEGQKIHNSLLLTSNREYRPKARPPVEDNIDFWGALRNGWMNQDWVELFPHDHTIKAIAIFIDEGDDTALRQITTWSDGLQLVYNGVISHLAVHSTVAVGVHSTVEVGDRDHLTRIVVTIPLDDDDELPGSFNPEIRLVLKMFELLKEPPPSMALAIDVRKSLSTKLQSRNCPEHYREVVMDFLKRFTRHACSESLNNSCYTSPIAFSPTGKYLVSSLDVNSGHLEFRKAPRWDRVRTPLQGHTARILTAAFSPTSNRVVSGSLDSTVLIWDTMTGKPVGNPFQGHTDSILSVAFSPDGMLVVSGSVDKTVQIWDASKGKPIGDPFRGHTGWVYCVAWSPDGRHVISGSSDNTIRIWDVEKGESIGGGLQGHTGSVLFVTFSPDGRHIISGSDDATLQIWDAESRTRVGDPFQGHTAEVLTAALSLDGSHVASGSFDGTIQIWDRTTKKKVGKPFQGPAGAVVFVAFLFDGRYLLSGYDNMTVRIWSVATRRPVENVFFGRSSIVSVTFSLDGKQVVIGRKDGKVLIWDVQIGRKIGEIGRHTNNLTFVAFSPDGRRVVSTSNDETMRILDTETGKQVGEPLQGHEQQVTSVAFSPDGRRVVSGSNGKTIRIWDMGTGKQVGEPLQGHEHQVASVAFSPDGRRVVSGSDDKTLRIWDTEMGKQVGEPCQGHECQITSVAFSPDGKYVVSGSDDKTMRIWDTETGKQFGEPFQGHGRQITSVAFSPDGRYVVSGLKRDTIRIWDTATRKQLGYPFDNRPYTPSSIAFSPDGNYVFFGTRCGHFIMWDMEYLQLMDSQINELL